MPQTRHRLPLPAAPALCRGLLLACALLLAGCSPWRIVGDQVVAFAEDDVIPRALREDDIVTACHGAEAMTSPVLAFTTVGTDVRRLAVLAHVGTALCAEQRILEAELAYLRAMHRQDPYAADDARVTQKRLHALAAQRAWNTANDYFGTVAGQCPAFRDDLDELVYLVGLVAGLQAVMNDSLGGQQAGVSLDVIPQVARGTTCLDSRRWWGAPEAIRTGLWVALPALGPEGVDPMAQLELNAHREAPGGVRLAHMAWALAAWSGNDRALTEQVLADFVASGNRYPAPAAYRLVDRFTEDFMLALSDRIWTEATGHRTPPGAFGTFPPR